MSEEVYKALFTLKKFNSENIYNKSMAKEDKEYYKKGMNILFYDYLEDINNKKTESIIYKIILNNQTNNYLENTSNKRMVIDFIAGMTDDLFMAELKSHYHIQ
jgi:dGTPase